MASTDPPPTTTPAHPLGETMSSAAAADPPEDGNDPNFTEVDVGNSMSDRWQGYTDFA